MSVFRGKAGQGTCVGSPIRYRLRQWRSRYWIPNGNGLVDRGLQCLAGLELRYILGGNLNLLTRPWVAAGGGVTMTNAKGAEANETYFRAFLKGGSDLLGDAIDSLRCVGLR